MSKSFKKAFIKNADSEKREKQRASRKLRRAVKKAINLGEDPHGKGLTDNWSWESEGMKVISNKKEDERK